MNVYKSIITIIDKVFILRFIILILLMIVGAFLEALGISLIIPIIGTVLSEGFKLSDQIILFIPFLEGMAREEVAIYAIASFIIFYFIKSIYLAFLVYAQSRYIYSVQENISTRLYKTYLNQPYSFHLKRNSGEIISNIITESMQFSQGLIAPIIYIITDILIICCISILLLYLEPLGALSVILVFLVSSSVIYSSSKKKSEKWGEKRQENEMNRIKSAQQGLNGIKEIKLHSLEGVFAKYFIKNTNISLDSGMKQTTLQGMPKILFEFITVLAISLLIFILFTSGTSSLEIISILGVFSLAAFKLLPSVSRLVTNLQSLNFTNPVVTKIKEEFKLEVNATKIKLDKNLRLNDKLVLSNIYFNYEDSEKINLKNINIKIDAGQSIGIIGTSGAGKSTLVDIILGLLMPNSGNIKIDDNHIDSNNLSSWQRNIGYVSQSIYLLDDTFKKNIAFGLSDQEIDETKLKNSIKLSQLEDFIKTLPNGLNSSVGESGVRISGGQRQRIGIARALYNNPSVLVLDEATSALDMETEGAVMESISKMKGNKTIITIAHRLTSVINCDYIYKLSDGVITEEGLPDKIF